MAESENSVNETAENSGNSEKAVEVANMVLDFLADTGYYSDEYDGGEISINLDATDDGYGDDWLEWESAEDFLVGEYTIFDAVNQYIGYDRDSYCGRFADACRPLASVGGSTVEEVEKSFDENFNKERIKQLKHELFMARGKVDYIESQLRELGVDPANA